MFTGLVEEIGTIEGRQPSGDGLLLEVSSRIIPGEVKTGDSICINGACQTVTGITTGSFTVFVSKVTKAVTTLGDLKSGARVNLERAMGPSGRFGGHFVQGHVDGKGVVANILRDADGIEYEIAIDKSLHRYIAAKGSVTVDGISLTVVSLTAGGFVIYLIPETVNRTTAALWKTGIEVNVEVDIIAKYVERMLGGNGQKGTDDAALEKKLREEGFA